MPDMKKIDFMAAVMRVDMAAECREAEAEGALEASRRAGTWGAPQRKVHEQAILAA